MLIEIFSQERTFRFWSQILEESTGGIFLLQTIPLVLIKGYRRQLYSVQWQANKYHTTTSWEYILLCIPLPIFIISQFCCASIFPSYTKYWWPKNETSHFSHGLWHQKQATSAAATSRISHLIFKTILGGLMLQNYYYYLVALEYFDAFDIYWQHPTTTYHVLMHICCALT